MATTGAKLPGSGTSVARSTATAWTNPGNITANDGTTASISSGSTGSAYLVASNFGFSIPAGSVINGITVVFEAAESATGSETVSAQLQDDTATLQGSVLTQSINGTGLTNYTYGGSANLWGSTLTVAQINDPDFGVRFWFTTTHAMTVDTVTMEVTYTEPVSGTLSASETGSDTFSSTGNVTVKGSLAVSETGSDAFDSQGSLTSALVGDLHATESGSDSFTSSGKVTVKGSLSATESADTFSSSGKVLVSGSASLSESGADAFDCQGSVLANSAVGDLHGYESGSDSFTSSGGVVISGAMSVSETGSDSFLASGDIIVNGSLDASESGADAFEANGYEELIVQGSLDASETGNDTASLSGELDTIFTLTANQALLLRKIHSLHGLSSPLVVSSTSRVAGDVVQVVAENGGTVTIETTGGNDTVSGNIGLLIEELAALHGITETLQVTETSRYAGSINQTINFVEGITTITRQ